MSESRHRLNNYCQQRWRRHGVVTFEVNDIGTPSAPSFEAVCYINNDEYSRESGSSTDSAREAAAEAALTLLIIEETTPVEQ